jgi:hypothetical protein
MHTFRRTLGATTLVHDRVVNLEGRDIRDKVDPEPSGWEGVADVRILQSIQQSVRFGRAVPIDAILRPRRPNLGQEIDVSAHAMPPLVDVQSASK